MNKKFTIPFYSVIFFLFSVFINFNIIFAGANTFILQDFDNTSFPPAGWTIANTSGYNWIRTTYASGYGQGTSSAMVDFYDYQNGNFELSTANFNPTSSTDSLSFDHAYTCGSNENDRLDIYTSNNGGSSWTLLISILGGASGPLKTANPTYDLFVPTSGQWATKKYVLPAGTNKIKFTGVTAYGNNLYLDNVKIGNAFTNDVGVNSIKSPRWSLTPQSIAPQASVRNYGNSTQSFQVTMTINPGGYTNTQSVSNLAPGQVAAVNFGSFNFASQGNYTLKCYSTLVSDQNRPNDTISNTLVVTNTQRNIVIEYCTGTWCQWCPCGDDEVHHAAVTYPNNTVILAYHGAGNDPWRIFNGNSIIGSLGFGGYPSGLVDRRLGSNNGWGSLFTDGENRLSQSPAATVNIATTNISYNPGTRQLTVNLNATALTTLTGQYKVNYVIKEDNLVYPQTGNSYCTGSPTWVHNWVVRNMVNGAAGENVNSGTWNTNQVYPLTFTTTLDAAWLAGNCRFDVFIYKDNGVLNTSEVQQGITSPYIVTGVNPIGNQVPDKYKLEQNYPNPFNPITNIHFSVPKAGEVSLKVYNAAGQLVGTYLDAHINAGNYNAEVDASSLASGIYFYTLSSKEFTQTKKMILVK